MNTFTLIICLLLCTVIQAADYVSYQYIICEQYDAVENCMRGRRFSQKVILQSIAEHWLEEDCCSHIIYGDLNNDGIVNFLDMARLKNEKTDY